MSSVEENKKIAQRFFHGVWDEGNFGMIDELTAADVVDHSNFGGKTEHGSESFKQIVGMVRSGMPDVKLTVEEEIAEGDMVVHRWHLNGTHTQPLMGIPPTGKTIMFTGTTIVRIKNGKITDRWSNVDELGMLTQLGVIPPMGGPPPA